MDFLINIFQKDITKRIIILSFLGLFLYITKSMINLFLLTFIFTFFMYSIQKSFSKRTKKFVRIKQRFIIIILYLLLAFGIALVLYKYVPELIRQTQDIAKKIAIFYEEAKVTPPENPILKYLYDQTQDIDFKSFANQGVGIIFKQANAVKNLSLDILFSVILSLFFLLEKNRIIRFTSRFKTSKVSFIYNEIEYFGSKFSNSFGKVLEAQVVIAFVNSVLSVIALWIMGFPQIFALGIMIFFLGLIPVAGVFISLVPLCMIAYSIGGFQMIIYVLVMITILHALEAYVLNPKLMSSKTELPIFYTFFILIFSEHFFGVWGLIIGIPIFMFILDLLDINQETKNTDITSDIDDVNND
jgi:predicted PurR-regulated permease PerM